MKRNFYIDNIKNKDDVNKLSIALNALDEVSRIKIRKHSISFACEQIEAIEALVLGVNDTLVLREQTPTQKRNFDIIDEKREMIFMFTNLNTQEDANAIQEILSKYSMYEEVKVDFSNKVLKITTADKKALLRVNRIIDKINPNIDVEQYKKPFQSQDIFQERYLQRYLRIGFLLIAIALGLVTKDDSNWITTVAWLGALLIVSEKIIINTYKDWKNKKFFKEREFILVACILGWIYGAYIESLLVSVIYQFGEAIIARLIGFTMKKIDAIINIPQVGRREVNGEVEMIPLDDFDIDDILVVLPGETIPLGGIVIEGFSTLNMYSVSGSEVLEEVLPWQEVQSGSVNVKNVLKIKVLYSYIHSGLTKVLKIATLAPINPSRTHKVIGMVSKYFTISVVVLAVVCGVVLPIVDMTNNMKYMYLGAILMTLSGTFAYQQASSFAVLAGVAKAFSKGIVIKENSGLDALNVCCTIIYDRFDGIEVTDEEMELFKNLKKLHKDLIIFNDGPVTLENDQYKIYNDLTLEQKMEVMGKVSVAGPVAYIGDTLKDVALMQKAFVAISRGGLHNKRVIDNCDILLLDSNYDTLIETFKISKKQRFVTIENIMLGITCNVILVMAAISFMLPWSIAAVAYIAVAASVLFNTHRIMR